MSLNKLFAQHRLSTRLSVIAFLFLCALNASAQNIALIDSMRKAVVKAPPKKQFELLNAIGFEFRYSFPDSTLAYCTRAFSLGKSLNLQKDLSKPLSFIGLAKANKGDYKESLKYHYQAIEVAIGQNDSVQLAFGYNNLGRMFFDEGDLPRAYTNLTRSRELFDVLKNKSGLAYVFRSLANVYKTQKDFSQALEMSNRAYTLRQEVGEPRAIVSALLELGLVYEAMNDLDKALEKFTQAAQLVVNINDKVTQAEVKMAVAETLFMKGKTDEALHEADDVLSVVTDQTNQKLFLRATLLRARYYYKKENYAAAIPLLERIHAGSKNNLSFLRDADFILADIYLKKGNSAKSNEYSSDYKIVDEKLQNTNLTLEVNQLKFKLELERIEKENEVLKIRQASDLNLISKQRFRNIILLITLVSVSGVWFVVWLNGRRRRLIHKQLEIQNQQIVYQGEEIAQKNRDLSQSNEELSLLNHEKDTLMNIVAHDLKAPMNQILGLVQLIELQGGLNAEQQEYIQLARSATNSGLGLILDLLDVNALREVKGEVVYQAFDWAAQIDERIKAFEASATAKKINLVLNNNAAAMVISEPKYLHRILDNLISNAIKFSPKGSTIAVSSTFDDHTAVVSVKDQGQGFTEDDRNFMFQRFRKLSATPTGGESSNGLGLTIVKTLVDRLGGEIQLISSRGKGSEFIVRIPVRIALKSAL